MVRSLQSTYLSPADCGFEHNMQPGLCKHVTAQARSEKTWGLLEPVDGVRYDPVHLLSALACGHALLSMLAAHGHVLLLMMVAAGQGTLRHVWSCLALPSM